MTYNRTITFTKNELLRLYTVSVDNRDLDIAPIERKALIVASINLDCETLLELIDDYTLGHFLDKNIRDFDYEEHEYAHEWLENGKVLFEDDRE